MPQGLDCKSANLIMEIDRKPTVACWAQQMLMPEIRAWLIQGISLLDSQKAADWAQGPTAEEGCKCISPHLGYLGGFT